MNVSVRVLFDVITSRCWVKDHIMHWNAKSTRLSLTYLNYFALIPALVR